MRQEATIAFPHRAQSPVATVDHYAELEAGSLAFSAPLLLERHASPLAKKVSTLSRKVLVREQGADMTIQATWSTATLVGQALLVGTAAMQGISTGSDHSANSAAYSTSSVHKGKVCS